MTTADEMIIDNNRRLIEHNGWVIQESETRSLKSLVDLLKANNKIMANQIKGFETSHTKEEILKCCKAELDSLIRTGHELQGKEILVTFETDSDQSLSDIIISHDVLSIDGVVVSVHDNLDKGLFINLLSLSVLEDQRENLGL